MSHFVTGFIIKTDFVHQVSSKYSSLRAVSLEQGFSLFPLTDKLIETRSSNSIDNRELNNLSNDLIDLLAKLSFVCPLLYFETEYFGGEGNQSAVVFENGKIIFGPTQAAIGPINEGLRLLGVITDSTSDEFDTIRLGEHRSTEDWLEQGE
jgi:hypothetical protein